MKKRGTFLVATLVAPLWVVRRSEREPGSVPPYAVRKAKEVMETLSDATTEVNTRSLSPGLPRASVIAAGYAFAS